MDEELERRFAEPLLAWFDRCGRRALPWQSNPTAYRVWVSEIMLQQTQVGTVMPYFERFLQRFATLEALAAAPIDEVLHLWTGLGYYARARNLHAAAQRIAARPGGDFPQTLDEMQSLPGVGRSTAGAILALAHGQRHPILDGNVKRVLARVFGIAGDPGSAPVLAALWARAEACTPQQRIAAYTQAIMDLGAAVCTRSKPRCGDCPLQGACVARAAGRQAELPGLKAKRARPSREATLLIVAADCEEGIAVLLERRPARGIWGGLWSPPQFDGAEAALAWCRRELGELEAGAETLAPIDHAFTHFDLRLVPLCVRCRPGARISDRDDQLWYALARPARIGLPQPVRRLIAELAAATAVSR